MAAPAVGRELQKLDPVFRSPRSAVKGFAVVARLGALAQGKLETTADKVDRVAESRIERDLQSLEWSPKPVWSSDVGAKSPPIFTSCLRADSTGVQRLIEFVQKWVRPAELGAARLYGMLARGFRVPATAAYIPKSKTYINAENRAERLSDADADTLEGSYKKIAALYQKEGSDEHPPILMLNEFVKGTSLSEFFRKTDPASLNEGFWMTLGEMAAIDFVFGNTDRLVRVMDLGDGYELDPAEANLDNIRVREGDDRLYAIDNEFGDGLSAADEEQANYTTFFESLIEDQTALVEQLGNMAAKCMISGLQNSDSVQGLKPLIDLLKQKNSPITPILKRGIAETLSRIRQQRLPAEVFEHLPKQVEARFRLLQTEA